jgi:hypothetical protein
MWIRSQDREHLLEVKCVEKIAQILPPYILYESYFKVNLGEYDTKKRTLEVLDEIQSKIPFGNRIYEMPKE